MKPILRHSIVIAAFFILVILVLGAWLRAASGVSVPTAPEGRISDYAKALDPVERQRLETLLAKFEQEARQSGKGAPQIAVVLLPSLRGDPLEETAMRFAESWKIGSKTDDGVLLLVAVSERKVRIEVGYGAEGPLTDARSARIIRDLIAPQLRLGDYAGGLRAGVTAIHQALSDQPITGGAPDREAAPAASPSAGLRGLGAVLLLLVLLYFLRRRGRGFPASFLLPWFLFGGGRGASGGGFSGGGFSGGGGRFGGGGASGDY